MTKIENIDVHLLRNVEHYQFMSDFERLVVSLGVEALDITNPFAQLSVAVSAEASANKVEQSSLLSNELELLDTLRDRTWNAISGRLQSTLLSPVDSEVAAAEKLLHVFELYGDPRSQPYNQESGMLANLTGLLASAENVQLSTELGLTAWILALQSQNESFINLFNERNSELASRENGSIKPARKATDAIYTQIVDIINARLVLGQASLSVTTFVSQHNERVRYYKLTLATRQGRKAKSTAAAATATK